MNINKMDKEFVLQIRKNLKKTKIDKLLEEVSSLNELIENVNEHKELLDGINKIKENLELI